MAVIARFGCDNTETAGTAGNPPDARRLCVGERRGTGAAGDSIEDYTDFFIFIR